MLRCVQRPRKPFSGMLLERIYDDLLAQSSYLLACQESKTAIVVDPNRDIDQYVAAAARQKLTIAYVTETHIHADFVSGSRELARKSGATLLLSAEGGDDWRYRFAESSGARLIRHGDTIDVGDVRIQVRHTPGHTPGSQCFLVDGRVVSGDTMFIDACGRVDFPGGD